MLAPELRSVVLGATLSLTAVITGALGAAVSTLSEKALLAALMLPAPSVAVALRVWGPVAKAEVVKVKVPAGLSVAVPSKVVPS